VIGKTFCLVNRNLRSFAGNRGRGNLIIDAPAYVLGPRLPPIGPPRVLLRFQVDAAEYIDPSKLVENLAEPGTLLRQEAGIFLVGTPVLQIDLLVGDIPVTAQNDFPAAGRELFEYREKLLHKKEFGGLPVFTAGTGRKVDGNYAQVAKVRAQIAPLRIDRGDTHAFDDLVGFAPAVNSHPAVAFFLGAVEIAVVAIGCEYFIVEVGGLGFQLLHAHNVGALQRQPAKKSFARGGAHAIQVKRYNSHVYFSRFVIAMSDFRQEFIEFAIHRNVLCFGEFKTKAGRMSPYFFNAGLFNDGDSLRRLGQFYAKAILAAQLPFDMLFGPAYKGIPLVSAIVIALAESGHNYSFCFNRKEAKDHGEGGSIVGAPLAGRVLIVDDVISAGVSVRESVELIRAAGATPCGVVIALDRMERGSGEMSAVQEVQHAYGIPVVSIVNLDSIMHYLQGRDDLANYLQAVQSYRTQYGVA